MACLILEKIEFCGDLAIFFQHVFYRESTCKGEAKQGQSIDWFFVVKIGNGAKTRTDLQKYESVTKNICCPWNRLTVFESVPEKELIFQFLYFKIVFNKYVVLLGFDFLDLLKRIGHEELLIWGCDFFEWKLILKNSFNGLDFIYFDF